MGSPALAAPPLRLVDPSEEATLQTEQAKLHAEIIRRADLRLAADDLHRALRPWQAALRLLEHKGL